MATRDYAGDGITVHWDSSRCVHVAACIRAQPAVFDPGRRPWVDVGAADAAAIAGAVERCPTGAPRSTWADGSGEAVPAVTTVRPVQNGPVVLRGALSLVDADGVEVEAGPRAALCRCGRSGNQPFCDNSHRRTAWESRPPLVAPADEPAAPDEICPPQEGF